MSVRPKVSIITPTHMRESFLPSLVDCFTAQTYPELELLILDDSPKPCTSSALTRDPRVRYMHSPARISIGEKRNRLIAASTGEIIVHFDDDDYYTPDYVTWMVDRLGDADLVKLVGWFAYSTSLDKYFYWQTDVALDLHYIVSPDATFAATRGSDLVGNFVRDNTWGYGFSYVYKKRVIGEQTRFADMNFGEDFLFFSQLVATNKNILLLNDTRGVVLHIMHRYNTSKIFPQYLLPAFLVREQFPPAAVRKIASLVPAT